METKTFDSKYQDLLSGIVDVAHKLVNHDREEIDYLYIYGSMENLNTFFNAFYEINGKPVKIHKIPTVSQKSHDLSDEAVDDFLDSGEALLNQVIELFQEDGREVPTQLKVVYDTKANSLNSYLSYEKHLVLSPPTKSNAQVYSEWFEEIESAKSN